MKRRILSIITALALCLSLCPTWALAAEADPALCKHHPEHTEDCGYIAPTEGRDCGHEHTEDCYTLGVLPDADGSNPYEVGADTENLLDCQHTHDSECGYAQADPGQPCGYECRICPIEDLIAALPDKVTEDNAEDVRGQLDEILALFSVLTEDEQEQIDLSRCYELQGALDGANAPMLAADGAATVEINGVTTTYATFKEAWDAANSGGRAILTLHQDVDVYSAMGYSALTVNAGSDIELRGGSYTITSNVETASGLTTIEVKGKFTLTDGTITNTSSDAGTCALLVRSGTTAVINGGTVTGRIGISEEGGSLTVTGGTVNGSAQGIGITGGSANISGGNVSASAGNGIFVYGNSKLTMTGGTVYGPECGVEVWCVGESGLSSVALSGGNISGGEYAIKVDDSPYNRINVSSLLGAGCAYYNESGSLIDYPETSSLTDSVTIGVCDHSSARWEQNDTEHQSICRGCNKQLSSAAPHSFTEFKDLGDGTHQIFCECGLEQGTENHTYGEWRDENGSHVRACTVCGSVDSGTHNFNWQDNDSDTHTGSCAICGLENTDAHSFGVWRDDGNGIGGTHTKTCSVCGRTETVPHNWEWTRTGTTHRGTCSDCGAIETGAHQVTEYQQYGDKDYHYSVCSVCGNVRTLHIFTSEWVDAGDAHTQTCQDCGYAKSESHVYGPYQQDSEEGHVRVCTVCGHKETGVHTASTSWQQADDGHYHLCNVCEWPMERTAHTYGVWKNEGAQGHSHTCSVCKYKQTVEHTLDANQRCTVCGYSAGEAAIVSIGGKDDQTFTELTDAWTYAANNSSADQPATVRLMLNAEISSGLEVSSGQNIILEMANGVALTSSGRGIGVMGGAFTLNSGKIYASGGDGISVTNGGTAHINGGDVTAKNCGVYANGAGTQVSIKGGSFSGKYAVQLALATAKITITGGTFSSTGESSIVFFGLSSAYVSTMIAEGSSVYGPDGNSVSSSDLAVRLLTGGPFTVRACEHSYEYNHKAGTTTHSQICTLCGNTMDTENCTFTNGTCVCGAELAVTLNGAEGLAYTGTAQEPGVTVTVDGTELAAANNYTVTYANNVNAGDTAKATVTGTSFEGTVELSFSIGKATPTIAWNPSYQVLTYTGQPADIKPVITLVNGETYDGPIYYTWPGFTNQLVLPTDAGFNGITASIPAKGNYTAAETEPVLILQINKANQDAPSAPTAAEENIKDNRITLDTIENAEYKRDEGEWQTSPVFTGLDPNHEYTFYVRLKEDKNHNASPSSAGAAITTKKTMLDGATVTVSGSYTYTGAAVVPAAGNVTVELNGVTIDASQYTISATNNVNVGTSTLTVTATADGNYSGSASTTFTISPATLTIKASDQTITYGQSITEGTGQVTATGLCAGDSLSSITLAASTRNVPGGTIELSAAQIKNSSGGDVTANYNITYEAGTLTINKAQATVTGDPTANTLTYTGAAQALVTAGTASIGEVVYSLTEMGTYSTTIPTGTNAGTYTVWYKVEGTTNYEGTAPVKVDVTIGKANYTGLMTASTSCKYGRDKTYDMSDLLPEGYVLGTITITDTNSIFEGTPTVSGAMLTYKLVNDSQKVNSTGTITIPVTESTNYNPFDLTITVTVTNVRIPNLNVNPISVIYTGNPVNSNQITGTATVDGIAIDGTWSFVSGQAITNVADSGVKRVTFTPNNTDLYGASSGTVVVTISKATPSLILTPSPATLPNGGMVTLTLSGLPDRSSATVTCSDENITVTKGSGNTWTAELPAGGASYTFAASYAGDGNHNGATANCTVRVEKITPVLSLTASPASPLIGGGTVTLTLSGLPAGGTASVTCSGGITVTVGAGNTWTAKLPNSTADYIFTASYAGNDSYHGANTTCTVETKEVVILPNPPADDGSTKFQLVMKDGISKVPAGLQNIEALNTPEKLETAMKTAITQANSGVHQANTAVYDVELQISTDGGTTWTKATAGNFPANGLTVTLPYPAGTNSSYTFTVVHMFTTSDFGKTPGDIETPRVINTASGLQFTVTGLSPVSVGWTAPATTPDTPSGGNHGGGGGGSVSTYAVTVEKSEHGKVTSNRTNASNGSTVTLTVTPDSGYVLDVLTVTDSRGNEIKLTAQSGGKYTFTMPSRAVTVKASFVPLPDDTQKPCDGGADCPSRSFTDLGSVGTWYHEAVDYVLRNGLMGGYGNGTFGPNNNLTRAQFAQILFNKEGRPVVNYLLQYGDVAEGAWYTEAIRWATSQGIVGGYGNGMFGPNDNITREQLAVMLWRYAGSPAATDKELHFTDADQASGYALEALRWAVENGIISGYGNGQLAPQGLATRGQVAQMLMNFLKNR